MLGRVHVTRKADRAAAGQKREQRGAIHGVAGRVFGIEIGAQRNMHGGHHQPLRRRLSEHIGHEGELPLAEAAGVIAIVAGLARVRAEVIDIVEHQEQGAAMLEGVIARAVGLLECLARIFPARRVQVQVMIANQIVPGHADLPDDAVVALVEGEVIGHDVPDRHPEGGLGADQRVHDVVADEADLGRAARHADRRT